MEEIASPLFIPQPLGSRFLESHTVAKKRILPVQLAGLSQQHNVSDSWNPRGWEWDSTRFVAKPVAFGDRHSGNILGNQERIEDQSNIAANNKYVEENDETLRLKLGGGGRAVEETGWKPSKKVRSGSPGGSNYPMCQVDNCGQNLSSAKDYHRRHKVCEVHSKASEALVGKQMQRFCQQCSRFHPLSEFDEGKRSCRRRLAGHNRRRRKTQLEDASVRSLAPRNHENAVTRDMDIVNLLAALSHVQGKSEDRTSSTLSMLPDKDQLVQILSQINSLSLPANLAAMFPVSAGVNGRAPGLVPSANDSPLSVRNSSPSTKDLLAALSANSPAISSGMHEIQSRRSSQGSDSEKTNSDSLDNATCLDLRKGHAFGLSSVGGERSITSHHGAIQNLDCHVQDTHIDVPLQLFSSSPETDSPPKLATSKKYFSSDSSNPSEGRSPSSSPPVVRTLFPMRTSRERVKSAIFSSAGDCNGNLKRTSEIGNTTALQLFGGSTGGADNCSVQSSPYRTDYTSSSGSDHSPPSLSSDNQDRTGRILFKLFDKDPSHLPVTLRMEIYNWLSSIPSEMESYIKPGCVVLSLYLSMSPSAWAQLEENLLQYTKSLVNNLDSEFWRSGRFLVHTDKQMASHKDGKIRLYKSCRAWSYPEIISVSPVAIVSGLDTSLLLRGRHLALPGIRVNCTHASGYTIKQVPASGQVTEYDEISLGGFTISSETPNFFGRCFVEVENGCRSTSFPVIFANSTVCEELRLLESEISGSTEMPDVISVDRNQDFGRPKSREEVLYFLNELGWLFQRKMNRSMFESPNYKLSRLQFLLIFSVEHDFCALVETLLDILLEMNLTKGDLAGESLEMLSEIHLLNRAVKRRCRNMVDFLVHYSIVQSDSSKKYIFPPSHPGPGGFTPLHVAACTSNSDDLIDSLTNDPQKIGIQCWNSLVDSNGSSPYAYASLRNNHSYNALVARKLADYRNSQVSVPIENEIAKAWATRSQNSCSKCVVAAGRYNKRISGSKSLLQRPYIHSMLVVAAVCVCVCLFFRGAPDIGSIAPFEWENLLYGPM